MTEGFPDYSQAPVNWPINAEHFSGTVDTNVTTLTFAGRSKLFLFDNMGWETIEISFDGGSNYFQIAPKTSLNAELGVDSIKVKAKTGLRGTNISYQAVNFY